MTEPTNPSNPFNSPTSVSWQTSIGLGPQPQPPTAPPPSVFVPRNAAEYFTEPGQQSAFVVGRQQQQLVLQQLGKPYTEQEEHKLVDRFWRTWYDEPWPGLFVDDNVPELDISKLSVRPMRKVSLKPFKLNYQTYQEIRLRLNNTVIGIKGNPFHVKRVIQKDKDFLLILDDGSKLQKINYKDVPDLRSIPPLYIKHGSRTGWLCRLPSRVYQQGLNRHNTVLYEPDCGRFASTMEVKPTLYGIQNREDRKWTESIASLFKGEELSTLRLNDDVAVKKNNDKIICCYRGRSLGEIKENVVIVDDSDDLLQGWIETAVQAAGLELRG